MNTKEIRVKLEDIENNGGVIMLQKEGKPTITVSPRRLRKGFFQFDDGDKIYHILSRQRATGDISSFLSKGWTVL